jgi:hypothetical protein
MSTWPWTATNIVASKYLHGTIGTGGKDSAGEKEMSEVYRVAVFFILPPSASQGFLSWVRSNCSRREWPSGEGKRKPRPGPDLPPLLHQPGVSPYDEIEWERRTAQITDAQGNATWLMIAYTATDDTDWSMTATIRRRSSASTT